MTTAQELLLSLAQRGVTVWVDAGRLRYRAPADVLTTDDKTTLAAVKEDVVRLLSQTTPADNSLPTEPGTLGVCVHRAHFVPTVTEGPTRQCQRCPHVWQVPCACGTASWKPTASWGTDGAGVVRWTCKGCEVRYGTDWEQAIPYTTTV